MDKQFLTPTKADREAAEARIDEIIARHAEYMGYPKSGQAFFRHSAVRAMVADALASARKHGLEESNGYREAFYEIGAMLGIGARPDPPKVVWERDMRPALIAALSQGVRP